MEKWKIKPVTGHQSNICDWWEHLHNCPLLLLPNPPSCPSNTGFITNRDARFYKLKKKIFLIHSVMTGKVNNWKYPFPNMRNPVLQHCFAFVRYLQVYCKYKTKTPNWHILSLISGIDVKFWLKRSVQVIVISLTKSILLHWKLFDQLMSCQDEGSPGEKVLIWVRIPPARKF